MDTFQIVRNNSIDISYANDYEEIRILKQLADELGICLLLVHHLRKQGDSDPFNKLTGTTGIVGDSMENRGMLLPKEMEQLVEFMKVQKKYSGSNTEFCERYNEYAGQAVSARGLKRLMNLWEYRLADFGVRFRSHRSNGARLLEIEYSFSAGDESAVGDG